MTSIEALDYAVACLQRMRPVLAEGDPAGQALVLMSERNDAIRTLLALRDLLADQQP